jgi:tripartite-type tricarboxylate transporter receptor subunit TctC
MKKFLASMLLALGAMAASLPAAAEGEAYPAKRIQLVVPFGVGSGIDQLAREYAEVLRVQMNTPVVVDTREGAGGLIGGALVAHAAPDGYTLMITANPPFAIAPQVQKTASYDPVASFAPVARLGAVPMVLVTSSASAFKTWKEMAEYFKANPDKANYAASGVGSPGQLFMQQVRSATGLPMREVSYKSTAQATIDTTGGHVQVNLESVAAVAQHIRSGTLRPLAVGSTQRLKEYPDVPTFAELIGQPGFDASVWYGIVAPAGTPANRVEKLYAEFAKASSSKRVVDFMARVGITPQLQSPAVFAAAIRKDTEIARKLVEAAHLKQE